MCYVSGHQLLSEGHILSKSIPNFFASCLSASRTEFDMWLSFLNLDKRSPPL